MSVTVITPRPKPRYNAQQFLAYQKSQSEGHRALDAFTNPLARIGAGTTNLLQGTEYPLTRLSRNYILMQSLYRSNWIVRKIVDSFAEDMVKNWVRVVTDLPPAQVSRFERVVSDTFTQNQILKTLQWARLFGGAGAVMIIDGDEDRLDEPLNVDEVLPGTYKGLIPFDRWSGITPASKLNTDMNFPADYNLPESYRVTTQQGNGFDVHCSRVLRFIGPDVPIWEKQAEVYWGISCVEVFYDELTKRDNTSWNLASLIFRANIFAMTQPDLASTLSGLGKSQVALMNFNATMQAIQAMMSNQGMLVLPKDGSLSTHSYGFAGIAEVYTHFKEDIAGAADYPYSRLFGKPSGGMGTTNESDEGVYYDNVGQKQKRELDPQLKKLMPIIAMSTWGRVPDDFTWTYNPVRTLNNEEQADLATKKTTPVIEAYNAGIIGRRTALMELKQQSDETGMFSNITDEAIAEADDAVMAMGEEVDEGMGLASEPGREEKSEEINPELKPKQKKAQVQDAATFKCKICGRVNPASAARCEECAEANPDGPFGKKASAKKERKRSSNGWIDKVLESDFSGGRGAGIARGKSILQSLILSREFGESVEKFENRRPDIKEFRRWFDNYSNGRGIDADLIRTPQEFRRLQVGPLSISIENETGEERSGIDVVTGTPWKVTMTYPYGFIDDTVGADGQEVDCFVGPWTSSREVYVIRSVSPHTGTYDEDKCMIGFRSATEAKAAFLENYSSPGFFGGMYQMTMQEFQNYLAHGAERVANAGA